MSQLLTQIQDFQNNVNSLSKATEFYGPERATSSGATHVPSQPSTILGPRTIPCRDSGLPRDTRNIVGTSENVFERLPAREGLSSTLFDNSKNLASPSQQLRPDTAGTTRRRENEMKRESLDKSIPLPRNTKRREREMRREPQDLSILVRRFQSRSGMLNHSGTYSHSGMMDYPRIPISEKNEGTFPDSMEFQSWNVNFRTEVCLRTADPQITMHWMREVEIAKTIGELMTSRSIMEAKRFPRLRYA